MIEFFDKLETSDWIASGALAVAGISLCFSYLGYRLQRVSRQDSLFQARYDYYKRMRGWWLKTGDFAPEGQSPFIEETDLISPAEEASFLFGKEVAQHILALPLTGHLGHPDFPDEAFIAPFRKHLQLEPDRESMRSTVGSWFRKWRRR